MFLLKNDHIELFSEKDAVYIKFFKSIDFKSFTICVEEYPRVQVTNILALRDALLKISPEPVKIGCLKPEIEIEIAVDEMKATIKLNLEEQDYQDRQKEIHFEIIRKLQEAGIKFGIKSDLFADDIPLKEKVIIAEGQPSTPGESAKVKYYELTEKKPRIEANGEVNHFEIQLFDVVEKGDWLGEKIPPQAGKDGITIKKNIIPAKKGKDLPLKYDPNTVEERIEPDGRIVLYARKNGAVNYVNQRIVVGNHYTLDGDVGYSSGNIDFDGYVTIKGTVDDCFTVKATKDISILSDNGIGAAGLIESTHGSIFIRGGVNGKGNAKIKAEKDVYLKYVNECSIEAAGSIIIGQYAYHSQLKADKIKIESYKGKIVGGNAIARYQVVSSTIGNRSENPTHVQVLGFSRSELKQKLAGLQKYYKEVIYKAGRLKNEVDVFGRNLNTLDERAVRTYHLMQLDFDKVLSEMEDLQDEASSISDLLRTRGDGEISILSEIYPKSAIRIKDISKSISETLHGSFYVKDNVMHYMHE